MDNPSFGKVLDFFGEFTPQEELRLIGVVLSFFLFGYVLIQATFDIRAKQREKANGQGRLSEDELMGVAWGLGIFVLGLPVSLVLFLWLVLD